MSEFAFYPLFGMPAVIISGMFAYFLFFITTLSFYLNQSGVKIIPFKWHQPLAIISLIVGAFHIFIAIMAFL